MGVTKGVYRYRCKHDPGKLYNNFCYTYLTKDQHPPSNLVVYSTIQCSTYIKTRLDLLGIKTFRWDQRLQIQNFFMAFKRVPRWR